MKKNQPKKVTNSDNPEDGDQKLNCCYSPSKDGSREQDDDQKLNCCYVEPTKESKRKS